ncbi:MAG: hypothetical protein GC146_02520 [Limimaricola sp.]|uniref:hypothetical protein n=1 Tax=Limimaricola sp. TaxID=2211665 RepID=UPI001E056815|nr:hypothetical protein [Limimaricola sp.]MBI1416074.1 hypothetical protein [Limimaricola sp.]
MQLTPPGKPPVILEIAYRYYDFGTAQGGTDVVAGGGASTPVQGLTFHNTDQVLSVSLRIPLTRY